ncbi:MAG TPA: PAS domain-containing sensor histidine kinase [Steroidobacteraceae bacterium]|nr:PAS domain-containing sensor histidine kinase [Steroidobacteraceae bacterium]
MVSTKGPAQAELAWRVLGLLNLFRLLVPLVLASLHYFLPETTSVGWADPGLFQVVVAAYFVSGIVMIAAIKRRWPGLQQQAWIHIAVDAAAVTLLLYTSGGVGSGLGMLLVIPVAAVSLITRRAFVIPALAALALLIQQVLAQLAGTASVGDYTAAGVLGVILFIVALSVQPLGERIRETEELVRQRDVDLANMAELSQYIVQHLRESILVIDASDRIRLINESAAEILGDLTAIPGALLGEVHPRLLYSLSTWRQSPHTAPINPTSFVAADGLRTIDPHFAPLGGENPGPVLVFLEDTSLLAERLQQSKLAALGRLSASIAHEIRNPVGAMSHAGQLLAEANVGESERRLTEIIRTNAERVSTIINNMLQLSRRDSTRPETLTLFDWLEEFRGEFCQTTQTPESRLKIAPDDDGIEVRVDPTHLHQVLWNLCDNALKYATPDDKAAIELRGGRVSGTGRPYLEVADRGPGIDKQHVDRIFEPFFTSGQGGTGLGLFIARELCQTNGALLLYEPRSGGGSIFRVIFSDPQRWQTRERRS